MKKHFFLGIVSFMISLYLCSRNHKNHVAEIMVSYTLFIFLACVSAHCLCLKDKRRRNQLTALSRLILYPAVALLAIGIFIGSALYCRKQVDESISLVRDHRFSHHYHNLFRSKLLYAQHAFVCWVNTTIVYWISTSDDILYRRK